MFACEQQHDLSQHSSVLVSGDAAVVALPKAILLAVSNLQDGVDIYDVSSDCRHIRKLKTPVRAETNVRLQVAFGQYGKILATGSDGGVIKIWDTISGALLQTLVHRRHSAIAVQSAISDEA